MGLDEKCPSKRHQKFWALDFAAEGQKAFAIIKHHSKITKSHTTTSNKYTILPIGILFRKS